MPDETSAADLCVPVEDVPKYYDGTGSCFSGGMLPDLLFDFKKRLGRDSFANLLPGTMSNLPGEALTNKLNKNQRQRAMTPWFFILKPIRLLDLFASII